MENLLPLNILEIPLEDTDLKYFGSLPIEKGKKHIVKIIPNPDFLIIEINGTIKKIDLGDSERLEQELHKGKTIEMDVVIGPITAKIAWQGKHLAGGSKATTMEIVEEIKVERKKAIPATDITPDIQTTINKIESNLLPFIAIQDIEIYRGSVSIQKTRNWYG